MIYHIISWLDSLYDIPGFGAFQYISFRAVITFLFSILFALIIGKKIISYLKRKLIGESIREDGPKSHSLKAGTPTMGGTIIIASILIPTLLWANLKNTYVILLVLSTLWIGTIGFLDDYIKVFKKDKKGLKGKFKIIGQVGLGLIVGISMVIHPHFEGRAGQVFPGKLIFPNKTLSEYGFQNGDRLLKINGKDYSAPPKDSDFGLLATYLVERGDVPGQRGQIALNIPLDKTSEVAGLLFKEKDDAFVTQTTIPFLKGISFNYSWLAFWDVENGIWGKVIYVLMVIFIVTAVSNSVNLTDGLDGLAAGTSAISAAALGVFCYISGNFIIANYLGIFFIPLSGEMVIFCAAMLGACVGFLWYNTFPAQVFMGDTGSLALGGAIAVVAIMAKKELLIPIMCGVFLIESLSVMMQVFWFKYTKKRTGEGKRIFKMAPIHHHFELSGLHESKIVTRFWIVAVFLAFLAFATFKLR